MSEKVCYGIDRPDSEVEPTRPDDYEAFARRYLADVASAMYHFAQGDDDASMDVNLARFDSHGNLSEDEFDIYRIEYKASENGGIGECRVYKIVPSKDDPQEATMQEITAQDANLDTCNTLGRIWEKTRTAARAWRP
ncbi:hypothetical protein [Candidatus Nanosynsacchari sp. TM7_ANC_38.39_G1_1]|uniref:hypothetical protein n=1 Tax=Candidatus Nanosynsacchari sp. TM7_ANC_38.39_G1_1 TaxID=1986206 RepID=UPI00101D73A1|nr:hypothetical protein [Candidatus Nanosynsacchari sp. TM7_ANC_38.39_G1_1]RYC74148.1 hypothetical protein G1ANC_00181 [Candidatus Nanosynsacchari sp. TM7_ANC_38.39_G1_1]